MAAIVYVLSFTSSLAVLAAWSQFISNFFYFCNQSRVQMSTNIDNDVSMNPPKCTQVFETNEYLVAIYWTKKAVS